MNTNSESNVSPNLNPSVSGAASAGLELLKKKFQEGAKAEDLHYEDLIALSPAEFVDYLKQQGVQKFFLRYDAQSDRVMASHSALEPLARFLEDDSRDFKNHEGVFIQVSPGQQTLQGAFVHNTVRGQASGGSRYWTYDTVEDFLRDGLRLSKGMTRKNALAGLWWGGGKGVIARDPRVEDQNPAVRAEIFEDYGKFVSSLRGAYITAEDVGTNETDIANIFKGTRYAICIPEKVGGSGNPSAHTAFGVVCGMEAACHYLDGSTLEGKKVVVQGMGHVGEAMIGFLFDKGVAEVVASDISEKVIARVAKRFQDKNLRTVLTARGDNSILAEPCDILAPNACGAILNDETIPQIQAKIVCGGANNQLEDAQRDDQALFDRGIWYVPDFLVNRMGIVYCANEQYGSIDEDPYIQQHLNQEWERSIFRTTLQVLETAKNKNTPPAKVAIELADELAKTPHPIFGHRGQVIIDGLDRSGWGRSTN